MAQEVPAWEFFGGYSYQRTNVREYFRSTPIILTFRNQYANLHGWDVSATENVNGWFGGTLDISGHYRSPELRGTTSHERIHSILYGPRFSFRKPWGIPFAHVLFGIAQADVRVTPGPHASDLSFAAAAGGGVDMNFRPNAKIRAFQLEYFHANALGSSRNHFRLSAGMVFNLGQIK